MSINTYLMWIIRDPVISVMQHSGSIVLCRDRKVYVVENTCIPVMCVISHSGSRVILIIHQHIHSGECPYVCDVCFK